MNKISGYKVTQTGARRIVLFTMETQELGDGGKSETITTEVVYSYGPRDPLPSNPDEDAWQYTLPNGETYSHPNKHGCLHLILSDAIGAETAHTRAAPKSGVINHY